MDKNLLSEINRNREIMGLDLISEAYEIKSEGTVKDAGAAIDAYLRKKGIRGLNAIPGYNQLQTLMQSAKFVVYPTTIMGSKGRKLTPENVISAIVQHMGGGSIKKGAKLFLRAIKEQGQSIFVDQKTLPVNLKGTSIATHGDVMQSQVKTDGTRAMNNSTTPNTLVTY